VFFSGPAAEALSYERDYLASGAFSQDEMFPR